MVATEVDGVKNVCPLKIGFVFSGIGGGCDSFCIPGGFPERRLSCMTLKSDLSDSYGASPAPRKSEYFAHDDTFPYD